MDTLEDLSRRSGSGTVGAPPASSPSGRRRFVGNGRGVMLGVLAIVAILTVARLVTMVWLLDAGWAWSLRQPLPPAVDRWMFPGPRAPVPLDRATWLTSADYADDADDAPWWQRIEPSVIGLRVSPEGKVQDCWTERTSGSAQLNDLACERIMQRARFVPAYDANGRAVAVDIRQRINWIARPYRIEPREWSYTIDMPAHGGALRCDAIMDGERLAVSAKECEREREWVQPLRRQTGLSGALRITVRTRSAVRSGAPPAPLPPPPARAQVVEENRLWMRVDSDGTAHDCRDEHIAGDRWAPPGRNPCTLERRVVSPATERDQQWVIQRRVMVETTPQL